MIIPNKVKIGGHIFEVIQRYKFKERSDRSGYANLQQCKIFISDVDTQGNPINITNIEEVFIHELLHCIDWIFLGNKLEEKDITILSEGLYSVLKDNPKLFSKKEKP